MSQSSFEYGVIARGIFTAMIWLVVLITFTSPVLLIIYLPFLLFVGLGLKPLLIKTGLASQYQAFVARHAERKNKQLRKSYYAQNSQKMNARNQHLESMRKKMQPKD